MLKLLSFMAASLVVSGCLTMTAAQRANTVGAGNSQNSVGVSAPMAVGAGVLAGPRLDYAFRAGASERVDVGVHVGAFYFPAVRGVGGELEFLTKFQLTNPSNERFAFSIAPSLGISGGVAAAGTAVGGGASVNLPVSFLFGIGLGEHQLVLGPKLHNSVLVTAGPIFTFGIGGTVGAALKITPSFQLMPEVGFLLPVAGVVGAGTATFAGASGVGLQLGMSFLFGGQAPESN